MISVVMPYWRRPEALDANVKHLQELYGDLIEIVVVDDGSWDMPDLPGILVVALPEKQQALNPCVPFNIGVGVSSGEHIVLTNPEVMHDTPILEQMISGRRSYVAAACRQGDKWLCHSTEDHSAGRGPMPKGAGLHFCAMLPRVLYDEVGGFDEAYRDGQGYEDNDFLWKLERAGAKFQIRDDLVVEHAGCPRSAWPKGGLARNKTIFERKWLR